MLHFPDFKSSREIYLENKLLCSTYLLSSLAILKLSPQPRCEAAILVSFDLVSSVFLSTIFHFQTHPRFCISQHPVGMGRIIGSFERGASEFLTIT
jgi:hypothetical protein